MILKDKSLFEMIVWKKEYSIVLILNILYIVFFYYIMTNYS